MAEFVRKGAKGAVGGVEKKAAGEGASVTTGVAVAPPVDLNLDLLKEPTPDGLEQLTEAVKASHRAALGQMGKAIIAAARAGQLLLAAKGSLPKGKKWTEYLAETYEFSQRTAYDYIDVAEAVVNDPELVDKCKSIREVLKLVNTRREEEGTKKKKDPKRESFVTYATKIERWFADEIAKSPLEDWSEERRATVKKMLDGVARIHASL